MSESLGVSCRTIRRWIEKGCPSIRAKSRGGPRPHLFDPLEVKAWLVANGITPKLRPAAPSGEDPRAEPSAPAHDLDSQGGAAGGETAARGFDGMHGRLTIAERVTFAAWVDAVKTHQHEASVQARARQWRDTAEALRKVEKDIAGIHRDREDWIARGAVEHFLERIAEEIRTKLLAIPAAVTPRLAGQKPVRIQAILTEAIRDVLLRLSKTEMP